MPKRIYVWRGDLTTSGHPKDNLDCKSAVRRGARQSHGKVCGRRILPELGKDDPTVKLTNATLTEYLAKVVEEGASGVELGQRGHRWPARCGLEPAELRSWKMGPSGARGGESRVCGGSSLAPSVPGVGATSAPLVGSSRGLSMWGGAASGSSSTGVTGASTTELPGSIDAAGRGGEGNRDGAAIGLERSMPAQRSWCRAPA